MTGVGVFDIIGPVMIGPSSSHTAGAARIGRMARIILKDEVESAEITFYGSFAKSYLGHGTDKAIVAGILGCHADDPIIRDAFAIAKERGLKFSINTSDEETPHPNTSKIVLTGKKGGKLKIVGVSLGGGKVSVVKINDFDVEVTGETYTLITVHHDEPGVVANVTAVLAKHQINISQMRVFRKAKHQDAVMIIDTDGKVPKELLDNIENVVGVSRVMAIEPL